MTKFFQIFKSNFTTYFKNNRLYLLLAFVSGILIGTTYVPFPAWALFFCYIPLWAATLLASEKNHSYKAIFSLGWVTQFTLTLIGFNWIYYTSREFGNLSFGISLGALLLFAALMHIYIPVALVLAVWIKRKWQLSQTTLLFILPLTLGLLERAWPSIFEWNLAYTLLWMKWPLFQWADVVGFWGLSTLILMVQALLLFCYLNYKKDKQFVGIVLATLIATLALLTYGGVSKQKKWSRNDSQVKFTLAQGNVGNDEKLASEKGQGYQPFVLSNYIQIIEAHLQKEPETDIILWPETALPFALDRSFHARLNQQRLVQQITKWNKVLVTGSYSQDITTLDILGNYLVSNSVFFIGPQGEQQPPYNKSQLLVFGEYMPFGKEFPFLYKLLPFVGVYKKGPGPVEKTITIADRPPIRLGPQICYESLDPAFSRGLSKAGAQIIFNVTNDSWFGDWAEPYQHMIMTLARAIEVRRPLVRATNTGISSVMLADGTELERSPLNQKWAHTYNVSYQQNPPETFYTLYGHWDWLFWIAVLAALILKGKYVRHQES